jgi:membrane protein
LRRIDDVRAVWEIVKEAVLECHENKAQRLAAALAYYVMCSLAPLLILIIAIIGAVYGEPNSADRVSAELREVLGPVAGDAIGTLVASLRALRPDRATTIIGVAGLLFVASGLFNHLRDSLNTIWEVRARPGQAVRGFFLSRLLAIAMVLSLSVVALVSLAIGIGLEAATRRLGALLPHDLASAALRCAQLLLMFVVILAVVALIYKFLPDAVIGWRDIWIGALVTSFLIVLGQVLLRFYLFSDFVGSTYSLVAAVVIILVWVYYSALIFFFGAELTWVYANRFGSRIVPASHALSLSAGDRAAQGMLRTSEIEAVAQQQEANL